MTRRYDCDTGCPVEATLDLIGGRWKGVILYHLLQGPRRFSELQQAIPVVSQRMLTRQLRELERAGLVLRAERGTYPRHVEYRCTPRGTSMAPIIEQLVTWGLAYLHEQHGHEVA